MTDPFTPDTFADNQAGNTPITAAKLNNIETAVDKLDIQNTKGDLLAHNGTTQVRHAVGTDGQVLTASSAAADGLAWSTVSGGASNATTSAPGLVQLAGDLAGTATAPTVPSLANKVGSVAAADATITVAGTATAPTVAVGAIPESKVTNLTTDLASKVPYLVPTATKTSAYTATANDYVLADVTTAWTLTLPTAPPDKTRVGAKIVVQPGTNALTIAVGGSDRFNITSGPTTGTISLLNQGVIWQYTASTSTWVGQASDLPLSQVDLRYIGSGGVTAANSTITVGGTATAPTIAVNAIAESQVTNLTTDLTGKLAAPANPAATSLVTVSSTGTVGTRALPDVQVFTASGTWTKPAGATTVFVALLSGGGGGGSGARLASGTASAGGAGGAGGAYSENTFRAADLGSTESVTVGAAGVGGAAVTVDSTAGNAGTASGACTFGTTIRVRASGAGGGGAGATSSSGAVGGGTGNYSGNGGGASNVGAAGSNASSSAFGPMGYGGGGGGGVSVTPAAFAGGTGANSTQLGGGGTGGAAGTAGGGNGGTATGAPANMPIGGGGGGGGGSSINSAAGAGAAGGSYGSGGGGGGSSLNTFASGAGGNGAPGIVIVTTW